MKGVGFATVTQHSRIAPGSAEQNWEEQRPRLGDIKPMAEIGVDIEW